jgi:dinuclear metal center YbgI/SA1388 family protein
MKIKDITDYLETIAPLSYQENYDNSGLLVGDKNQTLKGALITLDVTEEVLDEAIAKKCNLIIAHHPIIFGGLKRLTGRNYVERIVIKAIKSNIALYAIHTNYDNVLNGVNAKIADMIGLTNTQILVPKKQLLRKMQTFIPVGDFERVTAAVFAAGGGNIGNYSHAGFSTSGVGTFKGNEKSKPAIGKANQLEKVEEMKFETIFPAYLENKIMSALLAAHPYEEVAFDIISLENKNQQVGSGLIGELKKPLEIMAFLKSVKKNMKTECVRYTAPIGRMVQKVAVCGGAGSFLLGDALAAGADVFITGDFKYHEFFSAENQLTIADIGHYESEQFTKDLILQHLSEKFPIIAAQISETNTNPIKYL